MPPPPRRRPWSRGGPPRLPSPAAGHGAKKKGRGRRTAGHGAKERREREEGGRQRKGMGRRTAGHGGEEGEGKRGREI